MDLGFAVMDRAGIDPKYTVGREGWTTIKCASKRAYGCGSTGNTAVQDLDILLHQGDLENLSSSSLSVRTGDEVFRWIDQEIAEKKGRPANPGKDRFFMSEVEIVDKGLIVVTLSFSEYGGFHYYLVFDSFDRSLSMIPHIPEWATCCYTNCPLPLRHHNSGYSLVLIGTEFSFGQEGPKKYLWQWSPMAGIPDTWRTQKLRLPSEMKDKFFSPDVLFSCNGLAFWTDLALGTLFCDCSGLLSERYLVKSKFIPFPPGYQLDREKDTWPVEVYRTMGYVGGSVKFVAIDKPDDDLAGRRRVKVWTLATSGREWNLYSDFRLRKLWKDFKTAGLPKNLPMWPMLSEQDGGASLYLILADKTRTSDRGQKHYICRFDMPTQSLLQSRLLAHTSLILGPVKLPSGYFIKCLDPLSSRSGAHLDGSLIRRV